ncbi:unnamed protein product [Amoebophrya sp. A25]|nr:unnamed protein product [Amoebophrya sp. A25]|eukprot:GSA25T00008480001.1
MQQEQCPSPASTCSTESSVVQPRGGCNEVESASSKPLFYEFRFTADGFLRHMVRRLVGHIIEESLEIEIGAEHDESVATETSRDELLWRLFHAEDTREYKKPENHTKKPERAPPQGLWLWAARARGDVASA